MPQNLDSIIQLGQDMQRVPSCVDLSLVAEAVAYASTAHKVSRLNRHVDEAKNALLV